MFEILQLLLEHAVATFFLLLITGSGVGYLIDSAIKNKRLKMAHQLKMAQLRAHTETAKALAAAPEEAQRSALAQELLEAYGEAGEGLRNDEKGSLVRWELTKEE